MKTIASRIATLLLVLLSLLPVTSAQAAPDKRELQAREDFGAGRYQEALDVFAKLYAEKLHPVYLRNIGRCYQNLGNPERAISSFREYLRKMKHVSDDERAEIEGYIHEMEELEKSQAAAKTPVEPLPSAQRPSDPSGAVTLAPPPPLVTPPAMVTAAPSPAAPSPASSEDQPLYAHWWFWGAVGVVVVGAAVGTAAALGAFSPKDAPCTLEHC